MSFSVEDVARVRAQQSSPRFIAEADQVSSVLAHIMQHMVESQSLVKAGDEPAALEHTVRASVAIRKLERNMLESCLAALARDAAYLILELEKAAPDHPALSDG